MPPPSYLELPPAPGLAGTVRTVWIQTAGEAPYVQRHVPTGGAELHWPLGGSPRLLGPLTGPVIEVIPAGTTLVGVRFRPGAAPTSRPLRELVDHRPALEEIVGHRRYERVGDELAAAPTPRAALALLQRHLLHHVSTSDRDALVTEAVRLLMPWTPLGVGAVAERLGLSVSQLRRRCLDAVGLGPKSLQRTLRFQGFLALAQAGTATGLSGLAGEVGYSDQAHLGREVRRLTGLTPGGLLGGDGDRCRCGHDHAASYTPFLAGRAMRDPFNTGGCARS